MEADSFEQPVKSGGGKHVLLLYDYLLILIILNELLQLLDVPDRIEIVAHRRDDRQMRVIRELIIGDDAQNIIHLEAALLRLQAAGMRMRHINVHQVSQIQSQIGNARQLETLDVTAQIRPVIIIGKHLGEPIKRLFVLLR